MITTLTKQEALYIQGINKARERFGTEVRPVDETIWGLREVLQAGGRIACAIMTIHNLYHQPFILWTHQCMPLSELIRNIARNASGHILPEYQKKYDNERADRYYILRHAWDKVSLWSFMRQVNELIEREIKIQCPGLRKNQAKFKQLAQSVFAEACMVVLRRMSGLLNVQIGMLREHLLPEQSGTIAQDGAKLEKAANYLEEIADDLAILQPEDETIPKLRELAERFNEKGRQMVEPVNTAIKEMEDAAAAIDRALALLPKADAARRVGAREIREANNRQLKGVGRREFERLATVEFNKAEKIELEVEALLRSVSLLGPEEKLLCRL